MGRRLLRSGGAPRAAEQGFTLIEVMAAMAITITVMLANLSLFNTARTNLSRGRAITLATNLATSKISDFKAMTIAQITTGSDIPTADGIQFYRSWVVSNVDLQNDGTPDMVGDVVKVTLNVGWVLANKSHHVTMATFLAGKSE